MLFRSPATGVYSQAAAGFWIENGQVVRPVHGFTVAGNLQDMDRINEEIIATMSNESGGDDFSHEAFLEEANRRWAADPVAQPLKLRSLARQARVKAKLAIWRSAVQQKVIDDATTLVV